MKTMSRAAAQGKPHALKTGPLFRSRSQLNKMEVPTIRAPLGARKWCPEECRVTALMIW